MSKHKVKVCYCHVAELNIQMILCANSAKVSRNKKFYFT